MNVAPFRLRRRGALFGRSDAALGYLEFAGWMAEGLLWIDGWLTASAQESLEVLVEVEGKELQVRAEHLSYPRSDLSEISGAMGQVLLLPLDDARRIQALYIQQEGEWYRWTSRRGKPIHVDLAARLRHKLTAQPEIREQLAGFVDRCAGALTLDVGSDPLFQEHASLIRGPQPQEPEAVNPEVPAEPPAEAVPSEAVPVEASESEAPGEENVVNEQASEDEGDDDSYNIVPLEVCVADPSKPLGLSIETVIATGGEGFFVQGWIWDLHGVVEELELVHPDGRRFPLLGSLTRIERSDVIEMFRPTYGDRAEGRHGLLGLFEAGLPSGDARRYRFELRGRGRKLLASGMPPLATTLNTSRHALFGTLPEMRYEQDLGLLDHPIHAADELIRARWRKRVAISRSFEHGQISAEPKISLITPFFERVDLVEHHLAQLADDPGLSDCELIFVLDSPRHERWFERFTYHLANLYQLPIRGVVLSQRSGRAAAINTGAAHARGRLMVLMDSGVYPQQPDWLAALAERYDSSPEIGVVAPKLLYEDESLRHAGIYFAEGMEPDDLWTNVHFFQGLPRHHPAAQEARRVPAVSGACLMIARDLFERLGGLRDGYFDADYKAADLCLQCSLEGLECWYEPAVELFHLEGMSEAEAWRGNPWMGFYNRWLQTRRWNDQIRAVMQETTGD